MPQHNLDANQNPDLKILMAVMDKHHFLSLLTSMKHLVLTVTMRDYWRKWQGCIMSMSKWSNISLGECSFIKVKGNVKEMSPDFTTIILFLEPMQHLQIDPKNSRITMNLVQWHSSHHVYLHQREQNGSQTLAKNWTKTSSNWMKKSEPTQSRDRAGGSQNKPTIKINLEYLQPHIWKYIWLNGVQ